ncbi:hypothetical protein F5144DRAFT_133266 [Chaetomium tenue]|uniref:Uncharacterized protein n=1 Tax=Chaetomium tenue TaxID=1854479 RepID=A0ACB7PKA7_9PEZI|nr:hypothetical protein F5144DRAFT_133266 [Chaetomium globosum]
MGRSMFSWLLSKLANPILRRTPHPTAATDARDIANTHPHFELLNRQRQKLLRNAPSLVGQRPTKPPRDLVLSRFQLVASQNVRNAAMGRGGALRTSHLPPSYPPCVASFSELKKTMIDNLLLETHHQGTYILVRSLTPQNRMVAVTVVVEDENGDILPLLLYHQADDGEPLVREGTVMILKEPFLKAMADGSHGLRVDHLSDVVFLPANDKRIPVAWRRKPNHSSTALAWKAQGSNHFNQSEYRSAIECYTQSLTCPSTPEEICTTRLNRCLAFLKVGRYDAALLDTEFVLATAVAASKLAEKARLRKAEALYGLERYQECYEVLKELHLDHPDNAAAEVQRTRAITRLAEQTYGKYNFKRLHAEAAQRRPPYLDHATYIGPVRVQDAGSRGRGLFTTKAVKAGDLLFCEKAFTYAFDDENAGTGDSKLLMGHDGIATIGTQVDLFNMAIQKLYRNPSLIPTITNLHHGSYQPTATTQIDGQPIVDTFLLHRIIAINAFSSSLTTLTNLATPGPQTTPSASGIWPLASSLNHSCLGTAFRSFIGDFLIARATRDLPANAELTWWYHPLEASDRKETMRRQWGFECDCALCVDEGRLSEGVARRSREGLVEGIRRAVEAGSLDAVESDVEALQGTYVRPAVEVPRLEVWDILWEVVEGVVVRRRTVAPEQAARLILAALRALGYGIEGGERGTLVVREWGVMVSGVVECWVLLREAYRETAPELVAPAEQYARTAYRILVGEDESFGLFGEGRGVKGRSTTTTPRARRSPSVAARPSASDRLSGSSSPPRPTPPRPAATSRWKRSTGVPPP